MSLLLATLTAGLMAGVFFTYTNSVLPGLKATEDRTFVDAMQRMNVAILNGWFLLVFLGTAILAALALVLHWGTPARGWVAAGLLLYLVTLVVTFAVNVPLNNALDAAGPLAGIGDFASVRAAFEAKWVTWNLIRTLLSTGSFACLAWALTRA